MVGGAAGHNKDLLQAPDVIFAQAQLFEAHAPVFEAGRDGLAHRLRLLHDLLEHKVGIAALFRGAHVPVDKAVLLFHRLAQGVIDLDLPGADHSHLAVLHVGHVPGVFDDGGDVRGDEFAVLPIAQQQRRVLAGRNEAVRQILAQNPQGIGPFDAVQHRVDRRHDVSAVLKIKILQKLSHDLRVRVGAEVYPLGDKEFLDLQVVFNDPVVNHRDLPVLAQMGMGVDVIRLAVGGPAGVSDTHPALQSLPAVHKGAEHLEPALGLSQLQALLLRQYRDARRVIAPVFQPLQSVKQYRCRLLCTGIAHNSAHGVSPSCLQ